MVQPSQKMTKASHIIQKIWICHDIVQKNLQILEENLILRGLF